MQRRMLLAAAVGLAVLAAIYAGPAQDVVQPQADERTPAVAPAAAPSEAREASAPARVRDLDIEQAERRLNRSASRETIKNAFAPHTWAVRRAAPAPEPQAPPPVVNVAPTAPPLPYQYLGQLSEQGRTLVFLSRDEAPLVARVGEVLEGSYRIERIAETAVEFTYLPLKTRQVLSIGGLQ